MSSSLGQGAVRTVVEGEVRVNQKVSNHIFKGRLFGSLTGNNNIVEGMMIGNLNGDNNVIKKDLYGTVSGTGNQLCGFHIGANNGVGTLRGEEVRRPSYSLFSNTQSLLSPSDSKSLSILGPRTEEVLRQRANLLSEKITKKKKPTTAAPRVFATPKYHDLIERQDIHNFNKHATNTFTCKVGKDKKPHEHYEVFPVEENHIVIFCKTAFDVGNPKNLKIVFGDYARGMLSISKDSLSFCRFDGMEVWSPIAEGKPAFRFLSGEGFYEVDLQGVEKINGKCLEF